MQNVISFNQAQNLNKIKSENTAKKALMIAQMHELMNQAELRRKQLYEDYTKAFNSDNRKEMHKLSLEITEAGGMLRAFTKCANLVAINY